MNLNRMRQALSGVLVCASVLPFVMCTRSATMPSVSSAILGRVVTVTFRVMVRHPNSQDPIASAVVSDGHQRATTDADGWAQLTEQTDCALSVRAEAAGYTGFTAETDRLTGPETWTFYLEKR